ncbi:hypothetical protein JXB41_06000 [Candidatus Woesearchaeota archaeon]|nr:hypothetical protein [Candidatus Woesearchaeota archaeon]
MKIKDLKNGMQDVNIKAEIDYVPPHFKGKEWGIVYVKDETRDIKMIFIGENMKKAREGMKIRVRHGYVTEDRGELQLNSKKEHPVEFIG